MQPNNPTLSSNPSPRRHAAYTGHQRQRGVVLFMVLMVTLVIVALSVSLATGVFGEHRMSRNAADLAIARQAAEAALRDAELDINCKVWSAATPPALVKVTKTPPGVAIGSASAESAVARPICKLGDDGTGTVKGTIATSTCTDGLVSKAESAGDAMPSQTSLLGCSAAYGKFTGQAPLQLVSKQPIYMVEEYIAPQQASGNAVIAIYRIVARGYGRDPSTTVDLESSYRLTDSTKN
jgi:type IV pilus assembly protein PilX